MNLKELEDYAWFPETLRRLQSETIGRLVQLLGVLQKLPATAGDLLKERPYVKITDLCSGSGWPALYMQKHLKINLPMELTDKYPFSGLVSDTVQYRLEPLDVLQLVPQPDCFYTMYNAFHHFSTSEKLLLLQNFRNAGASLLVAEILQPGILSLLKVLLAGTIGTLLVAPFIKPFRFIRLLFTCIIPVNLLTVLTDGIISVFKSKTVQQYKKMLGPVQSENYTISVSRLNHFPHQIIVIIAKPIHVTT
jgi:hypothetical protein